MIVTHNRPDTLADIRASFGEVDDDRFTCPDGVVYEVIGGKWCTDFGGQRHYSHTKAAAVALLPSR